MASIGTARGDGQDAMGDGRRAGSVSRSDHPNLETARRRSRAWPRHPPPSRLPRSLWPWCALGDHGARRRPGSRPLERPVALYEARPGGHGRIYLGDRLTTIPALTQDIPPGLPFKILRDLGPDAI
jgi:hypothetical protein